MLGSGAYEAAYQASKKLVLYGAVGAAVLSAVNILFSPAYVAIYQVEPAVKQLTVQILFVYALIAPVKVLNMILGGGIITHSYLGLNSVIRSAGHPLYSMSYRISIQHLCLGWHGCCF